MKKVMSLEKCLMLLEHQISLGGRNKALFEAVYHHLKEYEPIYVLNKNFQKELENKKDDTELKNSILKIIDDKK